MTERKTYLDTATPGHPRLVMDVPPEQEASVQAALETLFQRGNGAAVQAVILEALLTAVEQAYFWTPEWQAKERSVDEAIAEGRVRTFDTMDDMLDFLDAR